MNQRGFLVVSLLILMPLIITALALTGAAFLLFKGDSATRHVCRVGLLKAQAQVAEDLEKLLAMNEEAETLQIKREDAELAVKLSKKVADGAKVGTGTYLGIVIAEQIAFAARQKALILHARLISRTAPGALRSKIAQAVKEVSAASTATPSSNTRTGSFPLVAKPPGSLTPTYKPAPNFSRSQTMSVRWSYPIARFLPAWFARQLNLNHLNTAAECAATIEEKEKGKWLPTLAKDPKARFLSSFWSLP